MAVDLDQARGQDGLSRRQLFEPTVDLTANERGVAGNAHGNLPRRQRTLIR